MLELRKKSQHNRKRECKHFGATGCARYLNLVRRIFAEVCMFFCVDFVILVRKQLTLTDQGIAYLLSMAFGNCYINFPFKVDSTVALVLILFLVPAVKLMRL